MTGDPLNVAKALWSGWRHNLCVITGQTASFRRILPLRMPLTERTLTSFGFELCV